MEIIQFSTALGSKWQTEHELRKIHEELERRIEERTQELTIVNKELQDDIARRKQVEERLRQLEQAVETMQIGVIITNLDGNIKTARR